MNSSFSIEFSETSTQVPQRSMTMSRIITHHFLSAKIRDPREEGFFDMLSSNVFPMFSILSFVAILCFLAAVGFALQLAFGGVSGPEFLQPGESAVTHWLAVDRWSLVHLKMFHQLVTCQFVHRDLASLATNIFLLAFAGSWAEAILTPFRAALCFLLTVTCANALVALYLPPGAQIAGLSSGIYGLLGAGLGCLILNWPNLYFLSFPRVFVFWMFSLLIGFSMVYARNDVDVTCQLIGVMVGLLAGLFCSPTQRVSERESRKFSGLQTAILVFGFLSYSLTLIGAVILILIS